MDTWGDLPKSQVDPSTVDQEIDSKIVDHLDDPDAHLEAGQSLQSHKASEIIDHIARSIVADKIADLGVENRTLVDDNLRFVVNFETLDALGAFSSGGGWYLNGLGFLQLVSGGVDGGRAGCMANSWSEGFACNYAKNPEFLALVYFGSVDSSYMYIVNGSLDVEVFGFKVVNGALKAVTIVLGTEYLTDLSFTVSADTLYRLRAVMTSSTKIEFYVNDVLKETVTTNLPSTVDEIGFFSLLCRSTGGDNDSMVVNQFIFEQDI